MRNVAVIEGDKASAQMVFGVAVNGFSVSELGDAVRAVPAARVNELVAEYEASYDVVASLKAGGANREAMLDAARIEIALRDFMVEGGYGAITDTFENLDGLKQLPGIAAQRLMADGYGFGAEGDWGSGMGSRPALETHGACKRTPKSRGPDLAHGSEVVPAAQPPGSTSRWVQISRTQRGRRLAGR